AAKPAPRPGTARPAAHRHHGGGVDVALGVGVQIPLTPGPQAYPDAAPPVGQPRRAEGGEDPVGPWPAEGARETDPAPALPPVAELGLDDRGWFAGDVVVLDLTLVDRRSGRPIWTRTVREEIDPRDAAAVARAVDRALQGQPWARGAAE
ncbi:MAG TPA: hypothetical protein VD838_17815, partial [Anaeromyxobacteraceae bacterium]|nr:hypothetical protein [Anaeromyxobacteraceae bacterium]